MISEDGSRKIFESYGWDSKEIARKIKLSLETAGYSVWFDEEQIRTDDDSRHFSYPIEKGLKDCQIVLFLESPHSVRGQTEKDERESVCYNELRVAHGLPRPVIRVRVSEYEGLPPFFIITKHFIDLINWYQPEVYQRRLDDLVHAIENVLAGDKDLDREIAFRVFGFASILNTAVDSFVGRKHLLDRFDRWLAGNRSCLLIEGETGSGKTAIAAKLVRDNPEKLLAYHFCTDTPLTLEPAAFIRSIAGMLANSIREYGERLRSGGLASWLGSDPKTLWSQLVLEPLHDLRRRDPHYILIDALDEAADPGGRISIPELLARVGNGFPDWIKLVVTSRPHHRITELFQDAERYDFASDESAKREQRDDVRRYIERCFAASDLSSGLDEARRRSAVDALAKRADGNFQYAYHVIKELRTQGMEMEDLEKLPGGLANLYQRSAERVAERLGGFEKAKTVLGVLLASREKALTESQIEAIIQPEAGEGLGHTLDALTCFLTWDFVEGRRACRFAHDSISDWLTAPGGSDRFKVDPMQVRELILRHCRGWAAHRETYALTHLISHLLEAGLTEEAMAAVRNGFFEERRGPVDPGCDLDDTRELVLALVRARDESTILELAKTGNPWQRDGVTAGLQAAPPDDDGLVDRVVGALLAAKS